MGLGPGDEHGVVAVGMGGWVGGLSNMLGADLMSGWMGGWVGG